MEKERYLQFYYHNSRENTLKKNDEEMEEELELMEQLHEKIDEAESTLFIEYF